jgi:DNA polymerase-3 subunit delta
VIVKSEEFDHFIARPPAQIFLYLFHGTDPGLVHERAKRIAKGSPASAHDFFQLVRLSGDQIASDAGLLADEAGSIGLFGDRRIIWIEAGGKSFVDALHYQLENPPVNCSIIVEAGNLKPTAPLRKLIENSPKAASIGCYADSPEDLKRLIEATLRGQGLNIDAEARDTLANMLGNDRMITRSELEKLTLYAHGSGAVTLEDIAAIMNDAAAVAQDEAIDAAFGGQRAQVEWHCQRVFHDGGDASYLLTSALAHALRLHRIRLDVESGGQIDTLLIRNGVFYARKRAVLSYLNRWRPDRLKAAIDVLQDTIAKARQQNRLSKILAVRAFWKIAGMVNQR